MSHTDVNWYYLNAKSPYYSCGLCVTDDKLCMITATKYVATMDEIKTCRYCNWQPKVDGLTRPREKHNGYIGLINPW